MEKLQNPPHMSRLETWNFSTWQILSSPIYNYIYIVDIGDKYEICRVSWFLDCAFKVQHSSSSWSSSSASSSSSSSSSASSPSWHWITASPDAAGWREEPSKESVFVEPASNDGTTTMQYIQYMLYTLYSEALNDGTTTVYMYIICLITLHKSIQWWNTNAVYNTYLDAITI